MPEDPKHPIRYESNEVGEWLEFDVPTSDGLATHRMRKIPAGSFMMGSPAYCLSRVERDDGGAERGR